MARSRPARTIPASPSLKSLIDEHYKSSESIVVGRRKYGYKCPHCSNKHQGFQRERTEVWQHIRGKAHLSRCPEDKTRFARWLSHEPDAEEGDASDDDSDATSADEPQTQTAGLTALAAAAEAVEDSEEDKNLQRGREKTADGAAAEKAHEGTETEQENAADDVGAAEAADEDDGADAADDVEAAEAAEENAEDDADAAETEHENVTDDAGAASAADEVADGADDVADTTHADGSITPPEETTPQPPETVKVAASPLKLTKQEKTGKINEFIDKVLPATPEFEKLRPQRNATSGWTVEVSALDEMFVNWLDADNIPNWRFVSELMKSLDSNKSSQVHCDRLKDKPRQRLLKKKI